MNAHESEHILACISSSPSNAKIIKTAAQMAKAFGGKFTALYVKTPSAEKMSNENIDRLKYHIKLAENLGAEIVTAYGDDIAQQIIEFSRLSGVTKVVLGRANVVGRRLFKNHTLTDKIIKGAPTLNVYIIPDSELNTVYKPHENAFAPALPKPIQIGAMLLALLIATATGFLFKWIGFLETNTVAVYMLGALVAALVTRNYICCGVFSFVGVLLFNFFFAEPRFSFAAYEYGYPVTFAVMLASSLVACTLAKRLSRNAELSADAAYRTNIMLETNRLLQNADSEEAVIRIMADRLGKLLSRNLTVYPVEEGGLGEPKFFEKSAQSGYSELLSPEERDIAIWVYENRRRAGRGTDRLSDAVGIYFSVRTDSDVFCVVGIDVAEKGLEPFENSILLSILGECALAMDNLKNAKQKEEIALLAKNEQMRANLLRAISHDLRTPLTSISGNAQNLFANSENIDTDTRRSLLSDINDDAEWLISLVENLLSVSRISEGKMNINMSAQLVDEVILEALKHTAGKAKERKIVTEFADELLLADMDARLITQVIINLVDNAVKYTPADTDIKITAVPEGNMIAVSVIDFGEGIADEHKRDVFRMFYTGGSGIADCRRSLGLGLSLCESIVNSHGGTLALVDNIPHGCIFKFTLKKSEVALNE